MPNTLIDLSPGDRIGYLDFDGYAHEGIVTAFIPDASGINAEFPGFVCWDPISEEHQWGYLSQVLEINGAMTTF